MTPTLRLPLTLVLLLATTSPLTAQNFVLNPAFDTDVLNWEAPDGALALSHIDMDGFIAPGAAEVEGVVIAPPFSNTVGIRQCVDLTGINLTKPLYAHMAIKPVNHDAAQPQILILYSDVADCGPPGIGLVDVDGVNPVQGEWSTIEGLIGLAPAGTLSVLFTAVAFTDSDSPDTLTRFDDGYFGADPFIFADGFESGDTSGWSSVQP